MDTHAFLLLALWAGGFAYCFLQSFNLRIPQRGRVWFSSALLLVLFSAPWHPTWGELWIGRWKLTLLLLTLGLATRIGRQMNWALATVFYSTTSSGLLTAYGQEMNGNQLLSLSVIGGAGAALSAFLLLNAYLYTAPKLHWISDTLGGLGFLTTLAVLVWTLVPGAHDSAPFFDNLSMTGIFFVCTLPLWLGGLNDRAKRLSILFVCLAVVALAKRGPYVALLTLGAAFMARQKKHPYLGAFYFAALFWVGLWAFLSGHLDMNGRSFVWGFTLHYWWDLSLVGKLFGAGLGSFRTYSPAFLPGDEVFFWAHNDWLQILFELGALGLLASLHLYIRTLLWSRHQPYLQAALLAYGVSMFTNYPLHWPLHALLGATLVARAYFARHV